MIQLGDFGLHLGQFNIDHTLHIGADAIRFIKLNWKQFTDFIEGKTYSFSP